jgi:aminopeptidase-like protein
MSPAGDGLGREMFDLVEELYPICRSITGDGVRRSLDILERTIPLTRTEVPTGTEVFDWKVPKEWNIRDACIKNARGERLIDFQKCNLHVLNYSTPVHAVVALPELRDHLFSIPDQPTWIPYRTSYYHETWGFCVTQVQLAALDEDQYEVVIDSSLTDGSLTYGECYLPGTRRDEVLISCHVCHPSLCNDNLSGISVAVFLARHLISRPHRYSYRFLFVPGTIGAITWLARNQHEVGRIKHGLVLTCLGDRGAFHYKKSRRGTTEIDRAAAYVLRTNRTPHEILEFSPYGYDERQFCSPGFNLPVGCLMRSVWGQFPEYHTSADNLDFITPGALQESLETCKAVTELLEQNRTYRSTNPFCEPALGRRGLYRSTGGTGIGVHNLACLWVLNLADGEHTLLDVAERSGLAFSVISEAATELAAHGLLEDTERGQNE